MGKITAMIKFQIKKLGWRPEISFELDNHTKNGLKKF